MQSLPRFNVSNKFKKDEENSIEIKPPLASSTMRADRPENKLENLKLGFGNLPEQMQRKAVKKGFSFSLLVVGESGLGKTTFVNTLLNQNIYGTKSELSSQELLERTTKVEKHFIELDEKGVKLRLTIVDTPGFGDGLDCTECSKPIIEYIDDTFYQFFKDECAINRKNIQDNRVHCCLYFISSTSRGLKPIDIEFMKTLHTKVNIIPVIAKADSLTEPELKRYKQTITEELVKNGINYYQPPICNSDDEDEFKAQDSEIRNSIPFAVIGSNTIVENENGRKVRGRQYPWGIVDVDNLKHCNFNILRTFILRTHMQDLKDVTNDMLYENYRGQLIQVRMTKRNTDKYSTMTSKADSTVSSIEDFVDTSSLLQEKEDELSRMQAKLTKIQSQLSNGSSQSNSNSYHKLPSKTPSISTNGGSESIKITNNVPQNSINNTTTTITTNGSTTLSVSTHNNNNNTSDAKSVQQPSPANSSIRSTSTVASK